MADVSSVLLSQGVLGVMVILETGLIWYLLSEVKRLGDKVQAVSAIAEDFKSLLQDEDRPIRQDLGQTKPLGEAPRKP